MQKSGPIVKNCYITSRTKKGKKPFSILPEDGSRKSTQRDAQLAYEKYQPAAVYKAAQMLTSKLKPSMNESASERGQKEEREEISNSNICMG